MAKPQIPTFEDVFEPFLAYGKLATEAAEKVFKIQMDSTKAFAKIGMENVSDGFKVTNFEQMTAYSEKQKGIFKTANDMIAADMKQYTDIGTELFENSRSLVEDTVKSSMEAAKTATKKATGK